MKRYESPNPNLEEKVWKFKDKDSDTTRDYYSWVYAMVNQLRAYGDEILENKVVSTRMEDRSMYSVVSRTWLWYHSRFVLRVVE